MSDYLPDDWPEAEGELPPSLEYLMGKFIQAIQGATGILKNDYQNVLLWYEAMRQALITYIQAAYMAGQNSDYIGETESGHIYEYVRTQVDYLNNFRLVIQSSSEYNAGWEQRAESYARGIVSPYWKGRTKMLPLPAMPGDLSTDCGQMCACLWDVKTLDEKAEDYDCYWVLNASRIVKTEHCQDCRTREVVWAPFRIRGGMVVGGAMDALPSDFRFRELGELIETTVKHLPGKHEQKAHGKRGVSNVVRLFEESIADQDYETVAFFDSKGNIAFTKNGDDRKIEFDESEINIVKNKELVFSHNHPNKEYSISLAPNDIYIGAKINAADIRISTNTFYYSMKRPKNGWPKNIEEIYKSVEKRIMDNFIQKIRNGKITIEEANRLHYHYVSREFAKEIGAKYSKTERVKP